MLYLLTFGFFIGYLVFLSTMVWLVISRILAPRMGASRGEAVVIFYFTIVVSLVFLILVNHYTGFLASIYRFFDDQFFGGIHHRRIL